MKDINSDSSIEKEKREKKLIEEKPKEEGNLLVKGYDGPDFGYLKRKKILKYQVQLEDKYNNMKKNVSKNY